MARTYKPKTDLSRLQYSPLINPLVKPQMVVTKRRYVRSGRSEDLINPNTGEVHGVATIHQVEERDDAEFVKVFAAGVAASYELTKTAQRVFQVVLDQYQRTPMNRGYADCVNLFWFDNGLEGRTVDMSEYTFKRGLRELVDKAFLSPKDSASFWTNPALFFKGNRVLFIKEFRRRKSIESNGLEKQIPTGDGLTQQSQPSLDGFEPDLPHILAEDESNYRGSGFSKADLIMAAAYDDFPELFEKQKKLKSDS